MRQRREFKCTNDVILYIHIATDIMCCLLNCRGSWEEKGSKIQAIQNLLERISLTGVTAVNTQLCARAVTHTQTDSHKQRNMHTCDISQCTKCLLRHPISRSLSRGDEASPHSPSKYHIRRETHKDTSIFEESSFKEQLYKHTFQTIPVNPT